MDEMLEKQDETIKVIREESEKTRVELKSEIRGVKEEVANLRSDLKGYMEAHLNGIYEEIAKIKRALRKAGIF